MDMQMCSKDSNTLFPLIFQSIGQTGHADMQFIAYWVSTSSIAMKWQGILQTKGKNRKNHNQLKTNLKSCDVVS